MHGPLISLLGRARGVGAVGVLLALLGVLVAGCGGGSAADEVRRPAGDHHAHASAVRTETVRRLRDFDQINRTRRGRLALDRKVLYHGRPSLRATVRGDPMADNAYARGVLNVRWDAGETVRYSVAVFLPVGFRDALEGQVDLMRWDNYPTYAADDARQPPGRYARASDLGGVSLFGDDHQLHVVAGTREAFTELTDGVVLTEGQWHTITVRQRISAVMPLTELIIDGVVVGTSHARWFNRLPIRRVRFGIVAISAGAQQEPLQLWFAEPRVAIRTPTHAS